MAITASKTIPKNTGKGKSDDLYIALNILF